MGFDLEKLPGFDGFCQRTKVNGNYEISSIEVFNAAYGQSLVYHYFLLRFDEPDKSRSTCLLCLPGGFPITVCGDYLALELMIKPGGVFGFGKHVICGQADGFCQVNDG